MPSKRTGGNHKCRIQELQEPAPTGAKEEEVDTREQESYLRHRQGLLEQEIERLRDEEEGEKANDSKHQDTADAKKKRHTAQN